MKNQTSKRITFGKIPEIIEAPDLLNIQLESWDAFLQSDSAPARRKNKGLQAVFKMNFPITDARENFLLEFVEYYVEKPKYSVPECEERGLTYAVPLKAKLRLSQKAEDGKSYANTIEQDAVGCLAAFVEKAEVYSRLLVAVEIGLAECDCVKTFLLHDKVRGVNL